MAADPTLLGAMASAASSTLDTALSYYSTKNLARQDQANYQKNLKLASKLNYESQRRMIENYPTYLRNSGMSPMMASGGAPTLAGASAPMGSHSGATPHTDFNAGVEAVKSAKMMPFEQANLESATTLNKAQAEKATAEAEKVKSETDESRARIKKYGAETSGIEEENKYRKRENVRETEYDFQIDQQARALYVAKSEAAETQYEKDYWDTLAHSERHYTKGMLQAQLDFASMLNSLDEYEKEATLRVLVRQVTNGQLADKGVISDLVHMPSTQAAKMIAETADLWSSKKWRDWQRETLGPVQAELLGTQAEATEHSDIVGMAEDGNYLGVGLTLLPTLLNSFGLFMAAKNLASKGKSFFQKGAKGNPSKGAPSGKTLSDSDVLKIRQDLKQKYPHASPQRLAQMEQDRIKQLKAKMK